MIERIKEISKINFKNYNFEDCFITFGNRKIFVPPSMAKAIIKYHEDASDKKSVERLLETLEGFIAINHMIK